MPFRDDIYVDWTLSPRIIVIELPSYELTVQDLIDTCRVLEANVDGIDELQIIEASGKEDLGGEVYVGITANLLNAQVMFASRAGALSSGTATSDDTNGTILTDTAADFITDGIYKGCTIYNKTTDAIATATEVIDLTHLRHTVLDGGSSIEWIATNEYLVWPNVQCFITGGNLVAEDENGNTMSPVHPSSHVLLVLSSSSNATFLELEALQYSSYQNAVWLDVNGANVGTAYPMGTREHPVNNLADAVAIALDKGFSTIEILSSMTIDAGTNIEEFILHGRSHVGTHLTIDTSAIASDVSIINCNIEGVLDGGTHIAECMVGDITYVNGCMHRCGLYGTITLDGGEDFAFFNCRIVDVNSLPIIDMGVSGQDCIATDYSGRILFTNLSGSNEINVQLDGGEVTIDSTIVSGTVRVSGVGTIVDNSGPGVVIITDGLMSKETVADAVWNEPISDYSGTGTAGKVLQDSKDLSLLGL